MNLDTIKKETAVITINNMLASNFFSICAVDRVADLLNVNPRGPEYDILHSLHCVHFDKMTKRVRDSIPELIMACLEKQTFQFPLPSQIEAAEAKIVQLQTAPPKSGGIRLRLPWTRD